MVSFHIFIWYASVEWISSYPLKMKRKLARCWSKSSKHTLYVTVIHCWTSRGFLTSFPFWAMTTQSWSCLSQWNSSNVFKDWSKAGKDCQSLFLQPRQNAMLVQFFKFYQSNFFSNCFCSRNDCLRRNEWNFKIKPSSFFNKS